MTQVQKRAEIIAIDENNNTQPDPILDTTHRFTQPNPNQTQARDILENHVNRIKHRL